MKNKIITLLCIICISNNGQTQMSESEIDKKTGFNGSFEVSKNSKPVNWIIYTNKTTKKGDFDIVLDKTEYQSGSQSLYFNVRECSNIGGRYSPGISQEIIANPGESYKISYWIKNSNSEFIVNISGVSAFKKDIGPVNRSSESYSDWTKFEHEYTVANKMNGLRFEVNILKPGEFWIDEININKM